MKHKSDNYKLFQYDEITITKIRQINIRKNKGKYKIVISKIPKEKYRNIFKGAYKRREKYVEKIKQENEIKKL